MIINTNNIEWHTMESPDLADAWLLMRYPFNGGWHESRKRITRWEMLNARVDILGNMKQEMIDEIEATVARPIEEWDAVGDLSP